MKLLELPQDKQEGLLKALLRFAYPLYCATEVEGFDYHFIGSCFPIRAGERIFFVFTNHQFKLAIGKTILIAYPENTEKLIGVESKYVAQFESLDLAIFEFSEKGVSEKLHTLDISLITKLDLEKDVEYAVLGCYRAVNVINHETKKIVVKKGALITELAKLDGGKAEFDFSGIYMVSGAKEILPNLKTINEQTQGLSGAPIVAFTINDVGEEKGDIDLHLVGVATHVSETDKKLYAANTTELLAALQHSFKIFPGYEEN